MKKRVKIIMAFVLAAAMICSFAGESFAGRESQIALFVLLDEEGLQGCTEHASKLDRMLDALTKEGLGAAFVFDPSSTEFNENFMTALVKIAACGFPVGQVTDSPEAASGGQPYIKFAVRKASRLLLEKTQGAFAADGYRVFSGFEEITRFVDAIQLLDRIDGRGNYLLRLNDTMIGEIPRLPQFARTYEIKFCYPTETGYIFFEQND